MPTKKKVDVDSVMTIINAEIKRQQEFKAFKTKVIKDTDPNSPNGPSTIVDAVSRIGVFDAKIEALQDIGAAILLIHGPEKPKKKE